MKIKAILISTLMVLSLSAFAQDLGTQVSDLQQQNRTVADAAAREYAEVSRRGKVRIDQLEGRIKSDQKELDAAKKSIREANDRIKNAQSNLKLRKEALKLQKKAYGIALAEDHVKQVHGFHLDEERQLMTFDIVVDFDAPDREAVRADVLKKIRAEYPAYDIVITLDSDTSD